jgi:hypothetical protein
MNANRPATAGQYDVAMVPSYSSASGARRHTRSRTAPVAAASVSKGLRACHRSPKIKLAKGTPTHKNT